MNLAKRIAGCGVLGTWIPHSAVRQRNADHSFIRSPRRMGQSVFSSRFSVICKTPLPASGGTPPNALLGRETGPRQSRFRYVSSPLSEANLGEVDRPKAETEGALHPPSGLRIAEDSLVTSPRHC